MWCRLPENKSLLLAVFMLVSFSSWAQEVTIEKLEEMVESKEYDQVISITEGLLASGSNRLSRARLYQLQADALYYINKVQESLAAYLKAIETASQSEVPDLLLLVECHSDAGFWYSELGLHKNAMDHYFRSLDYALEYKDSFQLASAYYNVGAGYQKLGDYTNAITYANKAYAIDLARKDTFGLAFDLNQMGYLSNQSGDNTKAIELFKESIKMHEKGGGNANSIGGRLNSIGFAFRQMGMLDSALHYVSKSLAEHQKIQDSINIAERWVSLAGIYNQQKKYAEARKLVQQAMAYYEGLDESEQLAAARVTLSENHLLTGQFDAAEQLVYANISFCKRNGLLAQLKNSYELYSTIKEYKGQYIEALDAYKMYNVLEDSLLTLTNRNSISELNIKYDVDSKEQQNKILQLENEVQLSQIEQQEVRERWLVFSLVVIFISMMAVTLAVGSRYKAKRLQLEAEVNEMRTKIKVVLNQDAEVLGLELDDVNQRLAQPLSEREFEILTHALSNLNNSEIAEKVFVSVNTVKYHLKNIYEKLGVTNRKEAMQFAMNQPKV
ncbi:MAG: LuxR family transcriptional regulator [Imperialibacter sp.]|uniref:LuxR family transcriptional regulator n=1 Tax=Imperialibacter sp. TaxID=2038411 RepID=UPI0032EB398A